MDMLTGAHIAAIRESLGETMKEFAERLGVSEGTISLWESGKRHPKWDTMVKLNELRNGKRKETVKA